MDFILFLYIAQIANQVEVSNRIDKAMWKRAVLAANGDDELEYDDAISLMISTFYSRLDWLDGAITNL